MDKQFWIILAICFVSICQGLNLTLDRRAQVLTAARRWCGVLICEETTVGPATTASDGGLNETADSFSKVTAMEIYRENPDSLNAKSGTPVASVTTQSPTLTRAANGCKITGKLAARKASIRVELFKHTDCMSEFTCRVRGTDSQGVKLVSTAKLTQKTNSDVMAFKHAENLTPALSFQLLFQLQQIGTNVAVVVRSVEENKRRYEDKIEQLEESVRALSSSLQNFAVEHRISERLDTFESRIEDITVNQHKNDHSRKSASGGSEIQNSALDALLTSLREQGETIENVSQTFRRLERDQANTTAALTTYFDTVLDQLKNDVQQNYILTSAQIERLNETVASGNSLAVQTKQVSLSTKLNLQEKFEQLSSHILVDNCNNIAHHVSKSHIATIDLIKSLMTDIFRPNVCEKGMVSIVSQGNFPYPVIYPSAFRFPYLCDTVTDSGGWIVIQRRANGDITFHRNWSDYKAGFGYLDSNFWLGNDNIHAITETGTYELRIELRSKGKSAFARYSTFSVSNEASNYTLRLGYYSGTAGDSLSYHKNQEFTTHDRDNDASKDNCAAFHKGGWWFRDCDASNLNGDWRGALNKGIEWNGFCPESQWIIFSEMKIRRLH